MLSLCDVRLIWLGSTLVIRLSRIQVPMFLGFSGFGAVPGAFNPKASAMLLARSATARAPCRFLSVRASGGFDVVLQLEL